MAISCLAKVHQLQSCPRNPYIDHQQVNLPQKRFLRVCSQPPNLRMGMKYMQVKLQAFIKFRQFLWLMMQ